MYDLSGQVAVVTGGASGIGGATARRLAADGAKVLIADINGVAARENAARITAAGGEAGVVVADMGNSADIAAMVEGAVEHWGRLDILVNNAYSPTAAHDTDSPDTTEESWESGLAVMAKALFLATKHAIPHMERNGGGNIVNISSVHGLLQSPGFLVYEASKSAVIGMTRQMAAELGPRGIRVNAICPGLVITDIIRENGPAVAEATGLSFDEMVDLFAQESAVKRPNTVEEVAAMAVLLASDAGAGITGATLSVDGGTAPY